MSADRKYIHPEALKALRAACTQANLRPVIVQSLGHAKDSAGYHEQDGAWQDDAGEWHPYCAAVDFSVNQKARRLTDNSSIAMDEQHIRWFLSCLANHGWVGWYRYQGSFAAKHLHAIYVGVKMKPQLRAQVRDFLSDRTGLSGHGKEAFYTAPPELDAKIKALFEAHNKDAP